jgi:hypothetical protein
VSVNSTNNCLPVVHSLTQACRQAQGVSFISNYILVTLESLGIQNVYTIVLVLYVVLFVTSLGAFYLPDRVGRRTCESSRVHCCVLKPR